MQRYIPPPFLLSPQATQAVALKTTARRARTTRRMATAAKTLAAPMTRRLTALPTAWSVAPSPRRQWRGLARWPASLRESLTSTEAELVDLLRVNRRGVAVALTSVAARSGLAALAAVLRVAEESTLIVANTINHLAFFEWGANRAKQHIRGSDSFRGSPWYSHIRYRGAHNETRWGLVRVVIREAAGVVRPCVVVQRFRQTDARPGCVLSEFGCQRLRWDFASSSDEWPRIEVVDVASILRLEQIHPDWMDLVDRHGVHAMPSNAPKTAEERRLAKFFTNAFYAWTTRPLKVIL